MKPVTIAIRSALRVIGLLCINMNLDVPLSQIMQTFIPPETQGHRSLVYLSIQKRRFYGTGAVSLNYCLMVTGPAYGNQRASSALQFAQALLACSHRLGTVFFYQEGVANANRLSAPASDEVDLVRAWHDLAQQHQVALHACVSAALRRGVTDALQASLLKRAGENLQPGFELSGLGTLAQAVLGCDRFIQF